MTDDSENVEDSERFKADLQTALKQFLALEPEPLDVAGPDATAAVDSLIAAVGVAFKAYPAPAAVESLLDAVIAACNAHDVPTGHWAAYGLLISKVGYALHQYREHAAASTRLLYGKVDGGEHDRK